MATTFDPFILFEPEFAQRALLAVVLVSVLSAALGAVIVLRDYPFLAHAVGAGTYPALVLGIALGVSLAVAAPVGAVVFALLLAAGGGRGLHGDGRDARTGLLVAQALAAGAILTTVAAPERLLLASPPEALLFGSVLTVDRAALGTLAAFSAVLAGVAWLLGPRWLAQGFDRGERPDSWTEPALLVSIALAVAVALPVTGSLLAGSLLVIPAATARIFATGVRQIVGGAFAIALAAGTAGLYLSLVFDLPAGATIAAVACTVFALAAIARVLVVRPPARLPAPALAAALLLPALALSGCGGGGHARDKKAAPLVVATTPAVADIVKNVGGNSILVTTLLDAGTDPHTYEPRPSDVRALAAARVVFKSGGDIDGWLDRAARAANADRTPVDLSQSGVLLPEPDGGGDSANAHWYLDASNVEAAAKRVRDELTKAYPLARETFRANAGTYTALVRRTDRALRACVTAAPRRPVIATGHDDFDYLARRYGIRLAAGLTSGGESEPSLIDVRDAARRARVAGTDAFAVSAGEAGGLEREFARRTGAPLLELHADSLARGGAASTLLGAIASDVSEIVTAAGGTPCRTP